MTNISNILITMTLLISQASADTDTADPARADQDSAPVAQQVTYTERPGLELIDLSSAQADPERFEAPSGRTIEQENVAVDDAPPAPDEVASYTGGAAARVRQPDGTPMAGHLYVLMATVGSHDRARLYDQTPFTHDQEPRADAAESNRLAAETAAEITGVEVDPVELTNAPRGGTSGGLIYLIAYLNLVSDGAFTAHVRVAATGALDAEGYIVHVRGMDEKLGAARLAGADVLFTPSSPSHPQLAAHAARHAGHTYRTRHGRVSLAEERGLDDYQLWGATQPDGVDVVNVGHIADVAAYLCGAGSVYACSIAGDLGLTITSDELTWYDIARAAHTPSDDVPLGDPSLGAIN
jgi:hypothetical protein